MVVVRVSFLHGLPAVNTGVTNTKMCLLFLLQFFVAYVNQPKALLMITNIKTHKMVRLLEESWEEPWGKRCNVCNESDVEKGPMDRSMGLKIYLAISIGFSLPEDCTKIKFLHWGNKTKKREMSWYVSRMGKIIRADRILYQKLMERGHL
jgi:hypothetical protein